jgi:hypothetical protein
MDEHQNGRVPRLANAAARPGAHPVSFGANSKDLGYQSYPSLLACRLEFLAHPFLECIHILRTTKKVFHQIIGGHRAAGF